MSGSLAPFLDPGSVAVIGASRDPFKVGGSVVANLRSAGFRGRIIPVNSRASTVQGLPAVPRVQDVDGPVALAVIAVPATPASTIAVTLGPISRIAASTKKPPRRSSAPKIVRKLAACRPGAA